MQNTVSQGLLSRPRTGGRGGGASLGETEGYALLQARLLTLLPKAASKVLKAPKRNVGGASHVARCRLNRCCASPAPGSQKVCAGEQTVHVTDFLICFAALTAKN